MSRVDVVIPCYNYGPYLRGCVRSVLDQPGVDVRVLVIDDCSPDNTPEVGAALSAEDSRVEYRRHAVNRGHIATYNEGLLGWASGDYCLLISADDYLAPGALGRAVRLMDRRPDVAMSHGHAVKVYTAEPDAPAPQPIVDEAYQISTGPDFLELLCSTVDNPVATPTAVVRTSVQRAVGGYLPELPHAGDMEMWLRCGAHGSVAAFSASQAFYRFHGQNMHTAFFRNPVRDLRQRKQAFDLFFERWGKRLSDVGRLQAESRRGLARSGFWSASVAFDRNDETACRELLDFALEMDPGIRRTPEWARFCWKQRMGARLWSWVRPVARGLRGRGRRLQPA